MGGNVTDGFSSSLSFSYGRLEGPSLSRSLSRSHGGGVPYRRRVASLLSRSLSLSLSQSRSRSRSLSRSRGGGETRCRLWDAYSRSSRLLFDSGEGGRLLVAADVTQASVLLLQNQIEI